MYKDLKWVLMYRQIKHIARRKKSYVCTDKLSS